VVAAAEFIGNPCVLQCDYWMGTELYCVFVYASVGSDPNGFFYESFWDNEWALQHRRHSLAHTCCHDHDLVPELVYCVQWRAE